VIFTQYYLDCLSQASYLIGDETTGRAVVVDPQRDVHEYLADAAAAGLRIERVIETHFHADFLSGHLELADRTGAAICFGEAAEDAGYPITRLADGERIELGEVVLEIRSTPGHTPESISIVVWEHADDPTPYGVLTGDTLFIGDVGRPDLLASAGRDAGDMARDLYRSLHGRLLTLSDSVRVFPAHGAGSACGKNLSTETQSTIGEQRRANYALAAMDEDAFVDIVTEGQPLTPPYFAFDARRNREAHALLDEENAPPPLTMTAALEAVRGGAVVLDVRDSADFAAGHLAGSLNVGLAGRFAESVGDVVGPDDRIVIVCEPGAELEAKVRLARIGFDNVIGHLAAPAAAFLERPDEIVRSSRLTADALERRRAELDDVVVVDVRGPGEVKLGSIPDAISVPLPRLMERIGELDPTRPTVVYCASGVRSSIAASLLRTKGFADVVDILGGFEAWRAMPAATA
jgi:glyoxylase-like metal-dependent hydrolase (beta-lactamase superfamily II)/rhodanese-related sulfurtransferase